jgi:hypothetical protein
MNRNNNYGKDSKSEKSVQKYMSERIIAADVYSDICRQTNKDYTKRPVKNHQTGFPFKIIENEGYQFIVGYFVYLPVTVCVFKIFNLWNHSKVFSKVRVWRELKKPFK